jgi:primosomal protein N' (replication factor Y) (superfamily II helicase)
MRFVEVAVDVPVRGNFTWRLPAALHAAPPLRGFRVMVPWSSAFRTGVVLRDTPDLPADVNPERLRDVLDVLDQERFVPEPQLALAEWAARYYLAPLGECVRLAVPPGSMPDADAVVRRVVQTTATTPRWLEDLPFDIAVPLRSLTSRADMRLADVMQGVREQAVVLEQENARGQIRQQSIERIRLAAAAAGTQLGARQQLVLEHLREWGESTWDELREACECSRATLNALVNRGLVSVEVERVWRDPFSGSTVLRRSSDPELTDEQTTALQQILNTLQQTGKKPLLLHGVTGSGKTEVYLRAVREAMRQGLQSLILLPEIALTPQFVGVFRAVLGDDIAVQHSGLTPGQRHDQWQRIRAGEVPLVIGARSALFAPMDRLGLIVVDEEHDPSFKQDTGVHYHARDLAVVLAHSTGAALVLGSATPSLESVGNVARGRYSVARMARRVANRPLPELQLIDMRSYPPDPEDPASHLVSPVLQKAVVDNATRGQQSILFLNRRGFAPTMECRACEQPLVCPHCDVSTTYHQRGHMARCHYCGFSVRVPRTCPTCGSEELAPKGAGTEQLETILETTFSGLRVIRLDADTSRGKGLSRILDTFRRGDADVLVGTQMVTKGHDFPGVTLVGVMQADQSLKFPDFRSGERTWQLLTQVAGRAGRAEMPGRVMIQTWNPDHFVLQCVLKGDYEAWKAQELTFRKRMGYPPFGSMVLLRVHAPEWPAAMEVAEHVAARVRRDGSRELRLVGPSDAPVTRIRGRFRIHLLVRGSERQDVHAAARLMRLTLDELDSGMRRGDVRADIDVDPLNML